MARGLEKDIEDIKNLSRNTSLNAGKLIKLFFDEYLYVSATGSHSLAILGLKEIIEELFGRYEYERLIPLIDSLTRK